jgi:hypothetical protein
MSKDSVISLENPEGIQICYESAEIRSQRFDY